MFMQAGDKSLVPEDLLRKLCNKRVDYYFIKIDSSTDKMIRIFSEVYKNSTSSFQQFEIGTDTAQFLPTVIKSIASSVSRSDAFKGMGISFEGLGLFV